MTSRRWFPWIAALLLVLASADLRDARGQLAGYPSIGQFGGGYGPSALSGYGGASSGGYGIRTGQYGSGYGSTAGLYRQGYGVQRAQTTVALQPLYSAITSLPGWDGPTRRVHRRSRPGPTEAQVLTLDHNGKILWPRTIPDDPASTALRQEAETAVLAVVRESKSTGHASIRPVIAAKEKLSTYERKILPAIKDRSVSEGDDLDRFFVELDRALEAMNSVYY
jgi:hypothetical protein